jgi:hypothetical protein
MPSRPPLLAFRSADDWAERLLRRECDAVLLAHAGLAADVHTAQPPGLSRELKSGVELIALGQRPLLLLHHSGNSDREAAPHPAARPPQGYLLPPAARCPLLLQALATGSQLPVQHCAASEPQIWLQQLADHCLLLPAHLTLLTISPWREAGLVPLQPLQPLCESLWLLLRCYDSSRPEFSALLQWWGGARPCNQPFSRVTSARKRHWWPWWPRKGPSS